jgi:hypothetical protein
VEFVGAAEDCEEEYDDREEEEEDDVENVAALEILIDDERVRDDEVDGRVRKDEDDDDNNESTEPALDDVEVAAVAKLTLNVLEDETPSTLLLLLLLAIDELLSTEKLLIDRAALLTTEVLLDNAELAAADAPKLELDRELDDGRLIDKGSAICEEVGAAGMDVLSGLEDKRATDEVVEDGFTDEVVEDDFTEVDATFDEVLLVNLTEEDEVEVGFCAFVRIIFTHKIWSIFITLELELEEIAFALLLDTTLLVDDETLELLEVVALLLTTELAGVDTGLAAVLALSADDDETFFELEESGLLELFAVVFEVEVGFVDDDDVVVDALVVTTLN